MINLQDLEKFSDNTAVIFNKFDEVKSIQYTYKEVTHSVRKLRKIFHEVPGLNLSNGKSPVETSFVGVLLGHQPAIVPVIVGILESGGAFFNLKEDDSITDIILSLKRLNIQLLITLQEFDSTQYKNWEVVKEVSIINNTIKIIRLLPNDVAPNCSIGRISQKLMTNHPIIKEKSKILFAISTSGSMGQPKLIQVTNNSFLPNVVSLRNIFQITSNDILFISSPTTFDPFVLDIFLALTSGAALRMVDKNLRLSPKRLLDILFNTSEQNTVGVTFMQITPSLFTRWSCLDIKKYILAENSPLRILVLGGECCPPLNQLALWQNWHINPKRIYNIYGLTEISCWSTIHEIGISDFLRSDTRVPIGKSIDDSCRIDVVNKNNESILNRHEGEGQLLIETEIRKNYISTGNNKYEINDDNSFRTGDIVEVKDQQIFFKYRMNRTQKRYGNIVDIELIERIALKYVNISNVRCILDHKTSNLLLFVQVDAFKKRLKGFHNFLKLNLNRNHIPDEIISLSVLPLSDHGKVSDAHLIQEWKRKQKQSIESKTINQSFLEMVRNIIDNKKVDEMLEKSFYMIGGNSFNALHIVTQLEQLYITSIPWLMMMLFDDSVPLQKIINKLRNHPVGIERKQQPNVPVQTEDSLDEKWTINWKINFKKCIDAQATLCILSSGLEIVSIGSHSNILMNIEVKSGCIQSILQLPDRIEGTVVPVNHMDLALIGCYDTHIYCFNLLTGEILWRYESGGIVRCKPLIIDDFAIIGNYGLKENLHCVNWKDGTLVWKKKIGTKSILSNPCLMQNGQFLVCTLDGTYCSMIHNNGNEVFTGAVGSPIFSSPQLIPQSNLIMFAEVAGLVHCIDFHGNKVWEFTANGNIYSSFDMIYDSKMCEWLIIFGCFDQNIYCLRYNLKMNEIKMLRTIQMQSQIFATPKFITTSNGESDIITCTTDGHLNILSMDNGLIEKCLKIDGEIFSIPIIWNNCVIFGCRNNYLYSIQFKCFTE